MKPWCLTLLAVLSACSPSATPREPEASARQAILGGAADTASTDVYLLGMTFNNGHAGVCTAVLLAPHTLLTAAHCVDPALASGATSVAVKATNKATDVGLMASDLVDIAEVRLHPSWVSASQPRAYDLALLRLPSPSPVTARAWNRDPLNAFTGKTLTVVGYGRLTSGDANSSGTRRTVDTPVTSVGSDTFNLGVNGVVGICNGDSGGPSFYRFPDGVQRLVGIHSGGTGGACGDGVDVRVDRQSAFLDAWLSVKDPPPPGCGADGQCATGCPAVDPDCPCAADGQCTSACSDATLDPDCPVDCGANGVCAQVPCPRNDADCIAPGLACTSDALCAQRLCVVDPATLERYCSQACSAAAPCPSGLVCDANATCLKPGGPTTPVGDPCTAGVTRCEPQTVCSGRLGGASTCRPACAVGDVCPEGTSCVDGLNSARYCDTPVPVAVDGGTSKEPADLKGGCGATASGPSFGLALLALAALRLCRPRLLAGPGVRGAVPSRDGRLRPHRHRFRARR